MAWRSDDWVLLRESLGGTVQRFEAAHAAALLAYPGTVWAEAKEELHEAAEAVAAWSAPVAAAEPENQFQAALGIGHQLAQDLKAPAEMPAPTPTETDY